MKSNTAKKSIWDNRLLWAAISLVSSVLMWVYVTTTIGDVHETEYEGVQVVFRGEDTLREKEGLVISNASTNTVTVKLRANRRELSKLSSSNMHAVVDVSKITATDKGNYTLTFTMEYPVGTDSNAIDVVSSFPQSVSFYVDKASSKSIEVKGEFVGSVVEGFAAGKLEFNPDTIVVTGPQNELDQIAYAWVSIPREDVDKTLMFDSEFVLMDSEGNTLDLPNVQSDSRTVSVTLPITSTKEVPLTVDLVAGAGATDENVKITVDPATIIIAGDAKTLEGINKISIGTVDLASFAVTYEDKFSVVLDNDITNVTGITEAKVTISVIGLETKRFSVTNITAINLPSGRRVEFETKELSVTLRGSSDVINAVKSNNIRAVVDLSDVGATTGAIELTAKIYVDGYTGVGAIGEYPLFVEVY